MEKILSQDEINALFSTMSADDSVLETPAEGTNAPKCNIARFDFCRSDRISKEQIRSIHMLHSHFARNYSASLSAYLRAAVEVSLISVDQVSYFEFLKQLSDPTLFCAISIPPLRGSLAMELNPALVYPIIDMLLGGSGNATDTGRPLTDIEMQIIEGVVKLALRDLKDAWRSVLEISPQMDSAETKPNMLQIVAPGEAVVAINFEVKVGENAGMLNLCIPSVMLKTNRTLFDQQRRHRRPDAGESETGKIGNLLQSARITVTSEIRDAALVVEDLLRMAEGDVVQLAHAVSDPILLKVGGIPKFCGRIVSRRGKRAFEITHRFVD